jgi:hypothetical protein
MTTSMDVFSAFFVRILSQFTHILQSVFTMRLE